MKMLSPQELRDFETWTVDTFNAGKLQSPIHLSGSKDDVQEKILIDIFKKIKKNDWVFTTYRSHYHALLKGVPKKALQRWILDNKSIHFMSKKYKMFTSAIVGGCLPIALGAALAIKQQKKKDHVYVFVGDMTASLGIFKEVSMYARFNDLPLTFVIEDNGLSTDTPTRQAWGCKNGDYLWFEEFNYKNVIYYKYERVYPHYGSGQFVKKLWDDVDKNDVRRKGF